MPWENKGGGGPWGGGGGGSGGGGPWGRGGGPGGGPRPPDFEDFIKRGQDSFRSILPGGGAGLGNSASLLLGLGVITLRLPTGPRSDETRGGNGGARTCTSGWPPYY